MAENINPTGPVIPEPPKRTIEAGFADDLPMTMAYKGSFEVFPNDDVSIRQLMDMKKTDGQARALFRLLTYPIRGALENATFVPEKNTEGGEEEAKFIEDLLTLPPPAGGMQTSINLVIAQMLEALFFGFAPFEMVYWVPDRGPLEGKITLKKMNYLPPHTVKFLLDSKGNFNGFRQITRGVNGKQIDVKIPKDQAVYYAAQEQERRFYGVSFFESAWHHWDKKVRLTFVMHVAAQRAALGTRVGSYPETGDPTDITDFKSALSKLGFAQWMAFPEGYEVESLKEGTTFDFLSYINHHNSQMSKSILAAFFDENQGSGGDANLVSFGVQDDKLFILMLKTIMSEVAAVINHYIIPRFIDWNFGTQKYPEFKWGPFTDEQKASIQEIFTTLAVSANTPNVSREFIHELEKKMAADLGLEIDYEAVEEQWEEEKEMEIMSPEGPNSENVISQEMLPQDFTLTLQTEDELIKLSGRKVASDAGAKRYGKPIGSPLDGSGSKSSATGRSFSSKENSKGDGTVKKSSDSRNNQGGNFDPTMKTAQGEPVDRAAIKQVMIHPKLKGVKLLVFADGTVQIVFPSGKRSKRVQFDAKRFADTGWVSGKEEDRNAERTSPKSKGLPGKSGDKK